MWPKKKSELNFTIRLLFVYLDIILSSIACSTRTSKQSGSMEPQRKRKQPTISSFFTSTPSKKSKSEESHLNATVALCSRAAKLAI